MLLESGRNLTAENAEERGENRESGALVPAFSFSALLCDLCGKKCRLNLYYTRNAKARDAVRQRFLGDSEVGLPNLAGGLSLREDQF
jgi:hypothetical protein